MDIKSFEHFFKPEARTSGKALVSKNKASASMLSDTEIQCYVNASTSFKVLLKSVSVSSKTILASCSCPQSQRGQFCKHIWATLLVTEDKFSDFLDGKLEIEKASVAVKTKAPSPASEAQAESKKAFAEKQAVYRKAQYQKQKERQKDFKKSKKGREEAAPQFPDDVEMALQFFSENGFPLRDSLSKASVGTAKKSLSRVFHPDFGGSHEEILELNRNSEILASFAKV